MFNLRLKESPTTYETPITFDRHFLVKTPITNVSQHKILRIYYMTYHLSVFLHSAVFIEYVPLPTTHAVHFLKLSTSTLSTVLAPYVQIDCNSMTTIRLMAYSILRNPILTAIFDDLFYHYLSILDQNLELFNDTLTLHQALYNAIPSLVTTMRELITQSFNLGLLHEHQIDDTLLPVLKAFSKSHLYFDAPPLNAATDFIQVRNLISMLTADDEEPLPSEIHNRISLFELSPLHIKIRETIDPILVHPFKGHHNVQSKTGPTLIRATSDQSSTTDRNGALLTALFPRSHFSHATHIANASVSTLNSGFIQSPIRVNTLGRFQTHQANITSSSFVDANIDESSCKILHDMLSFVKSKDDSYATSLAKHLLLDLRQLGQRSAKLCAFNSVKQTTAINAACQMIFQTEPSFHLNFNARRERLASLARSQVVAHIINNHTNYGPTLLPFLVNAFPVLLDLEFLPTANAIRRLFRVLSVINVLHRPASQPFRQLLDFSPSKLLQLAPPRVISALSSRETLIIMPVTSDLFASTDYVEDSTPPDNKMSWTKAIRLLSYSKHCGPPHLSIHPTRTPVQDTPTMELHDLASRRDSLALKRDYVLSFDSMLNVPYGPFNEQPIETIDDYDDYNDLDDVDWNY
jgi:hypothetical protein